MNRDQQDAQEFIRRLADPNLNDTSANAATRKIADALAKPGKKREDERKRSGKDDQTGGSRRLPGKGKE